MDDLTWRCHVCGDERPDHLIGVRTHHRVFNGVELAENVRHCTDRPDCVAGAETKRFLEGAEDA